MDFNKVFSNRATVRAFDRDRALGEKELMPILEAASHAPTTGNIQLYSVILNTDADMLRKLTELHLGQPAAKNCKAMLTFCSDKRRFAKWCEAGKTKSGFENLSGDVLAMIDACLFAQQFVTLAELQGIGACYLGTVVYNLDGFCDALCLPDGVLPLFSVALGYPADEKPTPSDRLPIDVVVHKEKYHDLDEAGIKAAYSFKESLPESARFIAENGKETLAQVYAEVRYPEEHNTSIAADLRKKLGL